MVASVKCFEYIHIYIAIWKNVSWWFLNGPNYFNVRLTFNCILMKYNCVFFIYYNEKYIGYSYQKITFMW